MWEAVAMSALKFFAVFEKYKFPLLSAFCAFIREMSPKIDSSSINFFPPNTFAGFGLENS